MSETFKGYYFITDARLSRAGNISDVISAISCKVSVVQYRNKDAETREMYYEAAGLDSCAGRQAQPT